LKKRRFAMEDLEAPLTTGGSSDVQDPLERIIEGYQTQGEADYTSSTGGQGLSPQEAERRLEEVGPNELSEKKENICLKFLSYFTGPMPYMIWAAIVIEFLVASWPAFAVLWALQLINGCIGFWEELNAGNAVEALKNQLAPEAIVKRGGAFQKIKARNLVPGDIINLKLGDVIPADCKLIENGKPMEIDQAALTGESLPITAHPGDKCLMGATIVRGELEALVMWTGKYTFFGRAAELVNSVEAKGRFQIVLFKVTLVLLGVAVTLVGVILIYLLVKNHSGEGVLFAIEQCVVILVASIPIAMQVVSTSTMAAGARKLAEKKVICTKLSAIEEMAGMNMLCSDKTGTLTLNKLELFDPIVIEPGMTADELKFHGALAAKRIAEGQDAIDKCITDTVRASPVSEFGAEGLDSYEEVEFLPFDPVIKRTEATIFKKGEGKDKAWKTTKGAPQVVLRMAHNYAEIDRKVSTVVQELADRGYRALGVARTEPGDLSGDKWIFTGVLSLFDPPRHDTKPTIKTSIEMGIEVKMITGDQTAIAKETARELGMGTNILDTEVLAYGTGAVPGYNKTLKEIVREADGFAEVFPEHKFQIVEILMDQGFTCGMTGDGVNDAPALKKANIGIAVEGSTDAARAAADIVLTEPGLSVIVDALLRSRKIFARVRNYAIYRVSATLQMCVSLFIIIIAFPTTNCWTNYERTIKASNGPIFDYSNTTPQTENTFTMPVIALVLITIFNDGCIITIAKDKVIPAKKPQGWNLREIYAIASFLAASLVIECCLLGAGCLACGNLEGGNTKTCGKWGVEVGHATTQQYCNFAPGVTWDPATKQATVPIVAPGGPTQQCVSGNKTCAAIGDSTNGQTAWYKYCQTDNAGMCDAINVLVQNSKTSKFTLDIGQVDQATKADPTGAVYNALCVSTTRRPKTGAHLATWNNLKVFADGYPGGCANALNIFCKSASHENPCTSSINNLLGDPRRGKVLGYQQFKTVIYMVISLSAFFTIYAARTKGPCYSRRPGGFLAAASVVAVGLTTVVAASVSQDSSLGMQPIAHDLGIVWAYVLIWFLFEDLVVKSTCYYVLSLFELDEDVALAKTMARKEASTAMGADQKAGRQGSALAGSDVGRVPSLIKSGELLTGSAGVAAAQQPASRLRSVEMKVDKMQGALLRKRVLEKSDLS
jgi:H+-transporting ATPase